MQERHEFMSFGLVQKYYFDPTFGGAFKPGQSNTFYPLDTVTGFYQTATPSNLAPISAILQFSQRSGIRNDIRADFDVNTQKWRDVSLSTSFREGAFSLSGTYLRIWRLEETLPVSNNIQGSVGYGSPRRGILANFTTRYNFETNKLLNTNTRIGYTWDCCGLGAVFKQYNLGQRRETSISFSFTLKGIGSFGNMERPVSVF